MTTTESTPEAVTAPEKPLNYRFSVLFTAFARFFRGFLLFVVIILVNAAIQTALVGFFDPVPGLSAVFIITVLISFVVLVASFYFLNITALTVATQKPKFATVFRRSAGQWGALRPLVSCHVPVGPTGFDRQYLSRPGGAAGFAIRHPRRGRRST